MPSYRYSYTYKSSKSTPVDDESPRHQENSTRHRRSRHRKSSSSAVESTSRKSNEPLRPLYLTVNKFCNGSWHQERENGGRHSHKEDREHRGHRDQDGRHGRNRADTANSREHLSSSSSSSSSPTTPAHCVKTNTMPSIYSFGENDRRASHHRSERRHVSDSPSFPTSYPSPPMPPPPYTSSEFFYNKYGAPPNMPTPCGVTSGGGDVVTGAGIASPMATLPVACSARCHGPSLPPCPCAGWFEHIYPCQPCHCFAVVHLFAWAVKSSEQTSGGNGEYGCSLYRHELRDYYYHGYV